MESQSEMLSFLDFLDLDEEIIDARLKSLMVRSTFSNKHLASIILLLSYKNLINKQEDTDCDNDEEFEFTVRLLREVNSGNVDDICKIVNIVLNLNKTSIVSKSEHLLQQIISNIDCQSNTSPGDVENRETLVNLKVCDSILDAAINNNEKISLLFLETPLEKVIDMADEKLKIHFLTNTVPRLFEGVVGYNILDRIWTYILSFNNEKIVNALKILSSLSDYYLPSPGFQGDSKYVSEIVFQYPFWNIILFGLESHDSALRKISVYLSKKAIDYVIGMKQAIKIQSETKTIFVWEANNDKTLKAMWDNFFILLDSLEEKQSNIVLPSLKLFESVQIGECWMNCAYNMGMRHDNTQIRLKCVEYRLRNAICNEADAVTVLEALNDINIYDQRSDCEALKAIISHSLSNIQSLAVIVEAVPLVKWSPVPLYHFSEVLSNLKQNYPFSHRVTDIIKIPCNNIAVRRAVNANMIHFINNCCGNINWMDVINVFSICDVRVPRNNNIHLLIKGISIKNEEKLALYKTLTESYKTIDYLLTYLFVNEEDVDILIGVVNEKIRTVHNIVKRQYSEKKEFLNEGTFLMHLLTKTSNKENRITAILNESIARESKTLSLYIQSLLSNDTSLTIEEMKTLIGDFNVFGKDYKELLLQLYKSCVLLIQNSIDLDKTVLSAIVIRATMGNQNMNEHFKHEMLDVRRLLEIVNKFKFDDLKNQSVGRLNNVLYETVCDILYMLIDEDNSRIDQDIKGVVNFVENVLECGGYGCLRLILKIINKTVRSLLNETIKFDMAQFINRTWNEIEELKSNSQYTPCIHEFINLLTQDAILDKSMFNNVVMLYCNKILEYGPLKNSPLHYLITVLYSKQNKDYDHLIYVLCEILLYCPVPRKDQRIVDKVTLEILRESKYGVNETDLDIHFNFEIQNLAVATLTKIENAETIKVISSFIIKRINETFKNKQRYHGNSQHHRLLLIALQHLLTLLIKSRSRLEEAFDWSCEMFSKLPHQPSVRICFEWYISLNYYIQKSVLNDEMLQTLRTKSVPLTSQFYIIYWILKHRISNDTYTNDEYQFVMDFLLSHTMGQLFNVRLLAQYLAFKLYNIAKLSSKYSYIIDIIERTFTDNVNDKNFVRLQNDYLVNDFDIIKNLSPYFIYYVLPRYCGDTCNEEVNNNMESVKHITDIDDNLRIDKDGDDFKKEWTDYCKSDEKFANIAISKDVKTKTADDMETSGTIQKKYVPWKNMSDVNAYDVEKKIESSSQLIVVASLIDKLPNLGGMARTSEVFGVKTYVVDSLRHLQDKQFQGLSVSAERWINVEEVRPGRPLKEYLSKKKAEGYSVVAAEQTSTSSKLQSFKFPKKTLLLLGHEKEGIPCDLLPMMDHCVEIPQQGYVRSLNVHVTAAIFVWEYARQNIL